MAPPFSPHVVGGLPVTAATTPAHPASTQRYANKENALYTPGAKTNADMVAEVREDPEVHRRRGLSSFLSHPFV